MLTYIQKGEFISYMETINVSKKLLFKNLNFPGVSYSSYQRWKRMFYKEGIEGLIPKTQRRIKKEDNEQIKSAIFELIHTPPISHNINRTTWKFEDLKRILLEEKGIVIKKDSIGRVLKSAGYRWRKARTVLTSNDPDYKAKLDKIKSILSNLKPDERFFSIDEFGPFSVKKRPGLNLVRFNEYPTVPQHQKSKGFLIIIAALELSENQIIHFYSQKKNTEKIIKLLNILLEKYSHCRKIYLSWDAASWHMSKQLRIKVEEINSGKCDKTYQVPEVELVPLPSSAQFLNVIESVFSGLARSIIHNSDYQSVDEAKTAIDRYFLERNEHFLKNPKRAGNTIWGKERVTCQFSESNNCKDTRFR